MIQKFATNISDDKYGKAYGQNKRTEWNRVQIARNIRKKSTYLLEKQSDKDFKHFGR